MTGRVQFRTQADVLEVPSREEASPERVYTLREADCAMFGLYPPVEPEDEKVGRLPVMLRRKFTRDVWRALRLIFGEDLAEIVEQPENKRFVVKLRRHRQYNWNVLRHDLNRKLEETGVELAIQVELNMSGLTLTASARGDLYENPEDVLHVDVELAPIGWTARAPTAVPMPCWFHRLR